LKPLGETGSGARCVEMIESNSLDRRSAGAAPGPRGLSRLGPQRGRLVTGFSRFIPRRSEIWNSGAVIRKFERVARER
jgi:hypothetical protein